jgi:hypothetical protein
MPMRTTSGARRLSGIRSGRGLRAHKKNRAECGGREEKAEILSPVDDASTENTNAKCQRTKLPFEALSTANSGVVYPDFPLQSNIIPQTAKSYNPISLEK